MIIEIRSKKEFDNIYKRIEHIIDILNKENVSGYINCSSTLIEKLHIHKKSIPFDNPLQILVSEGIYKMKLIFAYKNKIY